MDDEEFLRLIDEYLEPATEPNREMADVRIVWERENRQFGSRHIWETHRISEREVEEVLLAILPHVEAKRSADEPNRTLFWGATRFDRWIFVVCEDWTEDDTRFLRPITAFEPADGVKYWERFR